MTKPLSIIIPTWNNEEYLTPCVLSILQTGVHHSLADIIIVNNGKQDIERTFGGNESIKILNPGENLGWEKGLEYGMKHTDSPFLCFQNDDTFVPTFSMFAYQRMLAAFTHDEVAAVGPSTTCAAGLQSIFNPQTPRGVTEVSYLIFFTVMVRRAALEKVGGIDTTLPGGDDLDLSIRFRKAGYKILVDPFAFVYHHGFKTGTRVRGDQNQKGGWNSLEMTERTNQYLIKKHGFTTFFDMIRGLSYPPGINDVGDREGNLVRSLINGEQNVLELGCGGQKTVEKVIGVDRVPRGNPIPNLPNTLSVADVVANVDEDLPFEDNSQDAIIARHILEHCVDSVGTINRWKKILRPGGKLIIAVPDERVTSSIPLNPEHVHAFSPESLKTLLEICGFREVKTESSNNGISFVGCFERMN